VWRGVLHGFTSRAAVASATAEWAWKDAAGAPHNFSAAMSRASDTEWTTVMGPLDPDVAISYLVRVVGVDGQKTSSAVGRTSMPSCPG
jgi:hypothetical protein